MRRLSINFLISLATALIIGVCAVQDGSAQSANDKNDEASPMADNYSWRELFAENTGPTKKQKTSRFIKSADVAIERTIFYNNSDRPNLRATELSLFLEFCKLDGFQAFLIQRIFNDPDGNSHRNSGLKSEDFRNELVLGMRLKKVKKLREKIDLRLGVALGWMLSEDGALETFFPEPNPKIRDKIAEAEVSGKATYYLLDDLNIFGRIDIVGFYSKDKESDVGGLRHVVFNLALGGKLKFQERFFLKAALETSMQHDNHWGDSQIENWRAITGLGASF